MRKGGQVGLVGGVRGPGVRFRIVGRWSSKAVVGAEVSSQGKGLVTRWTVIVVWAVRRFLEGFGSVRKAAVA